MKDEPDNKRAVSRPDKPNTTARPMNMGWLPYLLLCAIGLVLALTSIGPSASEGLGTLNAMVFWAAHVIPAITLLTLVQIAFGLIERVSALPGIVQVLLSAIGASFLFAPIALGIDSLIAGEGARDNVNDSIVSLLGSELEHFFVPLVLIWTLINAPSLTQLERVGRRPMSVIKDGHADLEGLIPDVPSNAEFWSRIPGRLGRTLVALSAELHYLRVYTSEGETLILFPFGRAVDFLQNTHGIQVHRSHWVSLDHIDEVVTQDGRTVCHMVGGPSLPVSRSYRSSLKAARRGST